MFLRTLGKKHVDILSQWVGSAMVFGTTAGLGVVYFTEWRTVLQYLPYYNGKYPQEEEN